MSDVTLKIKIYCKKNDRGRRIWYADKIREKSKKENEKNNVLEKTVVCRKDSAIKMDGNSEKNDRKPHMKKTK